MTKNGPIDTMYRDPYSEVYTYTFRSLDPRLLGKTVDVVSLEDVRDEIKLPEPSHRHPMSGEPIWDANAVRAAIAVDRAERAQKVTFKELTLKARIVELEGEIESLLTPTEDMEIAGMEASVLGRPSVDDPAYVLSIYKAMIAAAHALGEDE